MSWKLFLVTMTWKGEEKDEKGLNFYVLHLRRKSPWERREQVKTGQDTAVGEPLAEPGSHSQKPAH